MATSAAYPKASSKEIPPTCSQQLGGFKRDSFLGILHWASQGIEIQPNHNPAFKHFSVSNRFCCRSHYSPFFLQGEKGEKGEKGGKG